MDCETISFQEWNVQLRKLNLKLHTSLQQLLRGMEIPDIKMIIRDGHLSSLRLLSDHSLATEDYEICAAIQQVIADRF